MTCGLSTGAGVIGSVAVDGSDYRQYKTGPGILMSFTRTENMLLWLTMDGGTHTHTPISHTCKLSLQ